MKKVFAILLILAVVAGVMFAADGDALKLKSTVGEVLPVYEIHASDKEGADKTGANPAVEVATGLDISVTDISWDFVIKQVGEKNSADETVTYAKTKKTATLTIELGHFTGVELAKVATDSPVFTAVTAVAPNDTNAEIAEAKRTVASLPEALNVASVDIDLTYTGEKWVDQDVINFTAKWTMDDTLPMDDYYATVTMTYTID